MESGLSQVGSNRLGESDLVGSPRDDFVPRLVGQELNFFGRDGLIFVGEGVRNAALALRFMIELKLLNLDSEAVKLHFTPS